MARDDRRFILKTLEALYESQLMGIRQLLDEYDVQKTERQKKGKRSRSLVDFITKILTEENRPLHVNQIVDLLQERYDRSTDRDTIASALSKKVRQGVLVQKTGPATFDLLKTENK